MVKSSNYVPVIGISLFGKAKGDLLVRDGIFSFKYKKGDLVPLRVSIKSGVPITQKLIGSPVVFYLHHVCRSWLSIHELCEIAYYYSDENGKVVVNEYNIYDGDKNES